MSEKSENTILNQSILSPADSLVRTSALRVSERASVENVPGYGANLLASLASFDLITFSWKTSQLCLTGELAEFSETWPRAGMTRNGTAYPLPPLVPLIAVTGLLLWPTPQAQMPGAGANSAKVKKLLTGNRHSFYLTQAVEA